jgi:hypothetical protein
MRSRSVADRQKRVLGNTAWHALSTAVPAWLRFVEAIEALGALHGDAMVGPKARDVAQQMHELSEVLRLWAES